MDLVAERKEAAEIHDQWTPRFWVDVRVFRIAGQEALVDVKFADVYLKGIGIHVLAERANVVNYALHLDRALENARGRDGSRWNRCQAGDCELIWFEAVSPALFFLRYGVFPGRQSEAIDMGDLML